MFWLKLQRRIKQIDRRNGAFSVFLPSFLSLFVGSYGLIYMLDGKYEVQALRSQSLTQRDLRMEQEHDQIEAMLRTNREYDLVPPPK